MSTYKYKKIFILWCLLVTMVLRKQYDMQIFRFTAGIWL